MSEHETGPLETGAAMNYEEHEHTYNAFINASKYVTMSLVILMIAMAAGFFTTIGFLGGIVLFVALNVLGFFLLRG